MSNHVVGFTNQGGVVAIRTADGKIDLDHRGREPGAGEKLIRLPRLFDQCELSDEARLTVVISTGGAYVLDDLPIGTKMAFATFGIGDFRSPGPDGLTIISYGIATNLCLEFVPQDESVTITPASGKSLMVDPPWDSVTLTKTGASSWAASGDFAPT